MHAFDILYLRFTSLRRLRVYALTEEGARRIARYRLTRFDAVIALHVDPLAPPYFINLDF